MLPRFVSIVEPDQDNSGNVVKDCNKKPSRGNSGKIMVVAMLIRMIMIQTGAIKNQTGQQWSGSPTHLRFIAIALQLALL